MNALGKKCLRSWKKYFPDYKIIRWDESNVDLNGCQYIKEAYAEKKWAFVSDYIRFKVMYEQGGVYFDTDVEVVRPFDDILAKGSFMGCEQPDLQNGIHVAPGLGFAVEPGHEVIKEIIDHYESSSFYNEDGSLGLQDTVVKRTTDVLRRHGLQESMEIQQVAGITIYPTDFFCPMHVNTHQIKMTENTYSIHHYAASWVPPAVRFRSKIYVTLCRFFGKDVADMIRKITRGK